MATTNLISKTLGEILLQSGNGTPNHTAPNGSIYSDIDNSEIYIIVSGSWEKLYKVSYGFGYIKDNTTSLGIDASNTWYLSGTTLLERISSGVSVSSNSMVIDTNRGGNYKIIISATLRNVINTNDFDVGISINNIVPSEFSRVTTTGTNRYNVVVSGFYDLSASDTIKIVIRNVNATNNVTITNAQIQVHKL